MTHYMLEFLFVKHRIDGYQPCAEGRSPVLDLEPFESIPEEQSNTVASPDVIGNEPRGDRVHMATKIGKGLHLPLKAHPWRSTEFIGCL